MHLGHVVPLHAVPDGDLVEAEHCQQHVRRGAITERDIHPDDRISAFEQAWKLLDLMSLDTLRADETYVHSAHHHLPISRLHARDRNRARRRPKVRLSTSSKRPSAGYPMESALVGARMESRASVRILLGTACAE